MLCEGVIWLDDWFAVEEVAPGVFPPASSDMMRNSV